jgi:ribonuclease BN (tRNA processing enzyme)
VGSFGLQIRLLGSGGWIPTEARELCCCLVRDGDEALVIDAGTGLRRLVADPEAMAGIARLHIVLTHWHLDHVSGLAYVSALGVPVELWARPPARELVQRLLGPPFAYPESSDVDAAFAAVHDLEPPGAQVGRFEVRVRVQPRHPGTTYALRLGDELAYCTDTGYDEENIEFVRGVRVLLHEAMHASDTTDDETHTAAGDAGRLAAAAQVGRLVLIHRHPLLADDEDLLRYARSTFPVAVVGRDGLEL